MTVDELLAVLVTLNEADRRRLFRRAQRMGLLRAADLESEHIPAAENHPATTHQSVRPAQPPTPVAEETEAKTPRLIALRPAPPAAPRRASRAQRSVAQNGPAANEVRVRIVFDGGSKGNPGQGYGSYALQWAGQAQPEVVRLTFGKRVTNNEAEYDTLIGALQDLLQRTEAAGVPPTQVFVEIFGDSQLVINQVNGSWKVNKPHLQARCDQARDLLQKFGFAALTYHPREESVAILGH